MTTELAFLNKLLLVRWLQVKRELSNAGPLYALFAVALYGILCVAIHAKAKGAAAWALPALALLIAIPTHRSRSDWRFVKTFAPNYQLVFGLEYSVIALLVTVPLLATGEIWPFLATHLLLFGVGFLPSAKTERANLHFIGRWVPSDNFEWIGGLRKQFFLFAAFYIGAFALLVYPYLTWLAVWFLLGITSSFYENGEPLHLLMLHNGDSKSFLSRKIKSHLKIWGFMTLPILLAYCSIHHDTWWVGLILYFFFLVNISLCILVKYSAYEPNAKLTANQMTIGFGQISMLLPFFWPVPFVLLVIYYGKAKGNLRGYLG